MSKLWQNIFSLIGMALLLAWLVSLAACGNTKQAVTTWTRQFGTSDYDEANAMVTDGSGNIYVAGWTKGTFSGQTSLGGNGDAFIAKYDSSGNEVWTRQFGTSGGDLAGAMVVDGSGNIYLGGLTLGTFSGQTSSGNNDAFIAKYDSSGNEVWTRQFGTSGGDYARAMVADESGNIYVAGWTDGIFSGQTSSDDEDAFSDAFIAKYDSSGNEVWTRQFGTSGSDYAQATVTDGSGNIYVAGLTNRTFSGQTSSGNQDAFIAKYDSSGNEAWTRQFGTSDHDSASGIALDSSSGNIYVVGTTSGTFSGQTSSGDLDSFIMKLRK